KIICGEMTNNKRDKIVPKLESEKTLINNEEDFKRVMKEDEIEKYLQGIVKFIDVEEATQFLNEALEIAKQLQEQELVNRDFAIKLSQQPSSKQVIIFRDSVFKEIVEKGVKKECECENPTVPYKNELVNNILLQ